MNNQPQPQQKVLESGSGQGIHPGTSVKHQPTNVIPNIINSVYESPIKKRPDSISKNVN